MLVIGNLKRGSFACLNFETMEQHTVQVNKSLVSCALLSENTWIVQDDHSSYFLLFGRNKRSAVLRRIMNNSSTFQGLECDRDENNPILASSDCVYVVFELGHFDTSFTHITRVTYTTHNAHPVSRHIHLLVTIRLEHSRISTLEHHARTQVRRAG